MTPTFFERPAAFRRWLAAHHGTSRELLVGLHKTTSDRGGMTYQEALDLALAYGWIDGVRKGLDAHSYTIRFTPRKKHSFWSAVNTKRVGVLIKEGRMKAPGLQAFRERDPERTSRYSYERENAALDAQSLRALRADKKAFAFFNAQPPGYRKLVTFVVMSPKREETRARRLAHLIEFCRAGKRIR